MKKFRILLAFIIFLAVGAAAYYTAHLNTYRQNPTHSIPKNKQLSERDKAIEQKLSSMSERDKVARLFILHAPGTNAAEINRYLASYKPGGLILMGDNLSGSNEELKQLTKQVKGDFDFPPLLAIDQEGGTVMRLAADTYPAGVTLAHAPASDTTAAFTERSKLLESVGIPLNFGIVADVTDDPSSFVYPRVLGTDAAGASQRVAAAVQAANGKTFSTLKHFPGHGESADNSHATIPTTDVSLEEWRQRDKPPFQAGIDAGAQFVMMGHLRYRAVDGEPASLSKKWYGILRDELNFKGIAITDDMFMLEQNPGYEDMARDAAKALQAGATMLLYVTDNVADSTKIEPSLLIDYVAAEVAAGRIDRKKVDTNVRRVLEAQYDSRRFTQ